MIPTIDMKKRWKIDVINKNSGMLIMAKWHRINIYKNEHINKSVVSGR